MKQTGHLTLRRLQELRRENRESATLYDWSWPGLLRQVFLSRYTRHRHGRIDDRSRQWRNYLEHDDG